MPDYYILGSKANMGDGRWEDRLPDMVRQNLLDVGYGWEHRSFERLYGKPEEEIVSALKKLLELPASYNAHKLFLNLRPGDWVAIKKSGAPHGSTPVLVIKAYARVVQRNGAVYRRGKSPLNHCINADFLEHGKEHKFHLGYGATIHRLSKPKHIRQIFAPVLGKRLKLEVTAPARKSQWRRRAALVGAVEDQTRRIRARTIEARQTHHRIRNKLYKQLVREHGEQKVFMERDWIDLQVDAHNGVILYEIKPYRSVLICLREALGQILSYAWMEKTIQSRRMKLIVVGPSTPTKEENEFIGFVKRNLKFDFDYLAFR